MYLFMVIVHVAAAIAVIGPALLAPFDGIKAVDRHDADDIHSQGRRTMFFNALTVGVFLTGALALPFSSDYGFSDPWVVISMTAYFIAAIVGIGVLPVTFAHCGKALQDNHSGDTATRIMIEQSRGRLTSMTTITAAMYGLIVIMMVVKPFS